MDSLIDGHYSSPVDAQLHSRLVDELEALRQPDGGLPTSIGGPSEVEPTAVAALVMRLRAQEWLRRRQRPDGGFGERNGRSDGPTTAALAALVLQDRGRARSALRFAVERRGLPLPNAKDPERREAWGWTSDARSLVEPTARVLLAVKRLTPSDRATRLEALRLFAERQCESGGWTTETLGLRRRPARVRADDRGRPHRAAGGERGAHGTRDSVPASVVAARAGRADRGAGARRVPPPCCPRRADAGTRAPGRARCAAVVP